jgi:hypothetical protein
MELADLFRDSFREFLIGLCHLFVTSRKGDIVPRALSFPLSIGISPDTVTIALEPRVCLR